jgi:hypothetical protein
MVPVDAVARSVGLATLVMVLVGCGPEIDDTPPQYQPRVCGQPAPVQVLAVSEPFRGLWTVGEVRGRWVVRRFKVYVIDGVRVPSFAADTVGPCGEQPVSLPEGLWPVTVGESLLGCDVLRGTFYAIDPLTGVRGEGMASGLECEPLRRIETGLVMLDAASQTLSIMDEQGAVFPTSIPLTIPEDRLDRLAPYLNNPLYPDSAVLSAHGSSDVWVHGDDAALWRLQPDGSHERVAEGIAMFRIDYTNDLVLIQHDEALAPEQPRLLILDPNTGMMREGPTVEDVRVTGG